MKDATPVIISNQTFRRTKAWQNEYMKPKPIEGKTALQEFTRTMKALFRVPKSEVQDNPKPKSSKKPPKPQHA